MQSLSRIMGDTEAELLIVKQLAYEKANGWACPGPEHKGKIRPRPKSRKVTGLTAAPLDNAQPSV